VPPRGSFCRYGFSRACSDDCSWASSSLLTRLDTSRSSATTPRSPSLSPNLGEARGGGGGGHGHASNYCTICARDSHGRIARSPEARQEFMTQTGYPHGRPGYVVDHVIPLKRGGADARIRPHNPSRPLCQRPVLALDVVHDCRPRPGQQCRHHEADALAAAGRREAEARSGLVSRDAGKGEWSLSAAQDMMACKSAAARDRELAVRVPDSARLPVAG
jgi:hypothetical protein